MQQVLSSNIEINDSEKQNSTLNNIMKIKQQKNHPLNLLSDQIKQLIMLEHQKLINPKGS